MQLSGGNIPRTTFLLYTRGICKNNSGYKAKIAMNAGSLSMGYQLIRLKEQNSVETPKVRLLETVSTMPGRASCKPHY
jgi:hypothetical protein